MADELIMSLKLDPREQERQLRELERRREKAEKADRRVREGGGAGRAPAAGKTKSGFDKANQRLGKRASRIDLRAGRAVVAPISAALVALVAREALGTIIQRAVAEAVEVFAGKDLAKRVELQIGKIREEIEAKISSVTAAVSAVKTAKDVAAVAGIVGTQDALSPDVLKSIAVADFSVQFLIEQSRSQAETVRNDQAYRNLTRSAGEWLTGTGPKRP